MGSGEYDPLMIVSLQLQQLLRKLVSYGLQDHHSKLSLNMQSRADRQRLRGEKWKKESRNLGA